MKLGLRIFGCYLAIFIVCFALPVGWILDTLRTRYLEGVEDPLVDQANILAGMVGRMMAEQRFDPGALQETFAQVYRRDVDARIYRLKKAQVDLFVYITDTRGRVIFHSRDPGQVGADYGHWRDVAATLEGGYGARTTLADESDETSSVLHVAAPILVRGKLAGVLTVAKPTTNINSFLRQAKPQLIKVVCLAVLAAVVLGYLVALWITKPIQRMTDYADAVSAGRRAVFPRLDRTEIGNMGRTLRKMQTALEGKAYVERYVQQLTHEIKSPLSAIRGSAELLEERMPAERRRTFRNHIRTEANRIQDIVDRMLALAALENRQQPARTEPVNVAAMVQAVLKSKHPLLLAKEIDVRVDLADGLEVTGDPFWLQQAVANLVQNAIDFSHKQGTIAVTAMEEGGNVAIRIADSGSTIPAYAVDKVFEKFYSLKRPDSGRRSTGLGLNLVRQVALLHQGRIRLRNLDPRGVQAELTLPASVPG